MSQFRNILVAIKLNAGREPIEFAVDPSSEVAVEQAGRLAAHAGARLTLMAVIAHPDLRDTSGTSDQDSQLPIVAAARQTLTELAAKAAPDSVPVEVVVSGGSAWHGLIRQTMNAGHDLIVAGTREVGRLRRMLYGSTGMKLLRHAPVPVWLVKPQATTPDDARGVLVATALDDVGLNALLTAVGVCQWMGTGLHVMHAVDLGLERHLRQTGMPTQEIERSIENARKDAERRLHDQLAQTDYRTLEHGVQVHLAEGTADVSILQAIDDLAIELVIMGTSGRGGIHGMLIGSTAERLLPEMNCSILAIKPDDFQCSIDPSNKT